jgi:hypothetical protein
VGEAVRKRWWAQGGNAEDKKKVQLVGSEGKKKILKVQTLLVRGQNPKLQRPFSVTQGVKSPGLKVGSTMNLTVWEEGRIEKTANGVADEGKGCARGYHLELIIGR